MIYKLTKEQKEQQLKKLQQEIEKRKHQFISGTYENKSSDFVIFCLQHKLKHKTTYSNYLRSKTGMPCCAKSQVSKKLKNRFFSIATKKKMQKAAFYRPLRNEKPRKWRKQREYLKWKNKVFETWNHKCAITGFDKKQSPLIVHHLMGVYKKKI